MRQNRNIWGLFLVLILLGFIAFGCADQKHMMQSEEAVTTPGLSGEELYMENCSNCHGEQGYGDIGPNIRNESPEEINNAISTVSRMGFLRELSSEQIQSISDYLNL